MDRIYHRLWVEFSSTIDGTIFGSRGNPMLPQLKRSGYYQVVMRRTDHTGERIKKSVNIGRFIWECHNPDIPDGFEINHKDGDKSNNSLKNLEIVTRSENIKHAFDTGLNVAKQGSDVLWSILTEDKVREIIRSFAINKKSNAELGLMYNVCGDTISLLRRKLIWNIVFDEPEFANYVITTSPRVFNKLDNTVKLAIINDLFTTDLNNREIQQKYNTNFSKLTNVRNEKIWLKLINQFKLQRPS